MAKPTVRWDACDFYILFFPSSGSGATKALLLVAPDPEALLRGDLSSFLISKFPCTSSPCLMKLEAYLPPLTQVVQTVRSEPLRVGHLFGHRCRINAYQGLGLGPSTRVSLRGSRGVSMYLRGLCNCNWVTADRCHHEHAQLYVIQQLSFRSERCSLPCASHPIQSWLHACN